MNVNRPSFEPKNNNLNCLLVLGERDVLDQIISRLIIMNDINSK